MDIVSGLNERQQQAVMAIHGPVLVLAGAGSGKTRTLAHRIAYIILQEKNNPSAVLAVTFTNKAAQEMRERVVKLLHLHSRSVPRFTTDLDQNIFPVMGTFHSISVRILRKEGGLLGYKPDYVIYDTHQQKINYLRPPSLKINQMVFWKNYQQKYINHIRIFYVAIRQWILMI